MYKEVQIKKEIVENQMVSIVCDKCKKEIYDIRKGESATWFRVTTGHYDWEEDSADSIEYADYCSPECLRLGLEDYIEGSEDSNTAYMEINKKYRRKQELPKEILDQISYSLGEDPGPEKEDTVVIGAD
jgi:hypothetical protein